MATAEVTLVRADGTRERYEEEAGAALRPAREYVTAEELLAALLGGEEEDNA